MIIKSKERIFDASGREVPICELDTKRCLVKSYHNVTMIKTLLEYYDGDISVNLHGEWCEYEFFSEAIKYHVNYVMAHNPSKFTELVNENAIFQYLWSLDLKVLNEVQAQVERWSEHAEDLKLARKRGDFLQIARIEKMLDLQAREVVYSCLVYRA